MSAASQTLPTVRAGSDLGCCLRLHSCRSHVAPVDRAARYGVPTAGAAPLHRKAGSLVAVLVTARAHAQWAGEIALLGRIRCPDTGKGAAHQLRSHLSSQPLSHREVHVLISAVG